MPEFAEVHRQVTWLRERVTGWTVRAWGVRARNHFPEFGAEPAEREQALARFLDGARVEQVTQRGKYVLLRLSTGVLASHLMFRGRWSLAGEDFVSPYKHHRAAPTPASNSLWLECDRGRMNFHDPEYKGHARAFPGASPAAVALLTALGPDVLQTDASDGEVASAPWDLARFTAGLGRVKQPVKAFLLDQKRQAGLGNMYACEALYRAKVRPDRDARSLGADEAAALHAAARAVVAESIESGLDYARTLAVYGRAEDPAGRAVRVTQVDGRDTYWVPDVQT